MNSQLARAPIAATRIDQEFLRRSPLSGMGTRVAGRGRGRGHVLIIGGSREMPGTAILSATAALRAGVGAITLITGESTAPLVAMALPEARILAAPELGTGALHPRGVRSLISSGYDAVLVGPGMQDEATCAAVAHAVTERVHEHVPMILDGGARSAVCFGPLSAFSGRPVLVSAYPDELAQLLGESSAGDDGAGDGREAALRAAHRWQSLVALKGDTTWVASATGSLWELADCSPGLASSGCGEVLAGLIAGLAGRGCALDVAAACGVALHARAGNVLASRFGPLGYFARDLPAEIPALMHALTA